MYRLPSRVLRFLALAVFVGSISPAHAQDPVPCVPQPEPQQPVIQCSDFHITSDSYFIHVRRKVGAQPSKVPVLLIHGSWGNALTWDFPGRSVMDNLAVRGYDVYAMDLRGEGDSKPLAGPVDYSQIDLLNRKADAAAVAIYIKTSTGRLPVVIGWSQGGVVAGMLAVASSSSLPTPPLVAGVGLFSVAPAGFTVPPQFIPLLPQLLAGPSVFLMENEVNGLVFGPLMSVDAENTFYALSAPDTDSTLAIEEAASQAFFSYFLRWNLITVPALVVDGALDPLVGEDLSVQLFGALTGTTNKRMMIYPRNSHGWFLEDNHDETVRVFDQFLSQFDHGRTSGEFTHNFAE
jgi:pimeloyl-ACP methyl ester carboxylesterase